MWTQVLRKFVKWVDPKLDRYRVKQPKKPYTPQSLEEFIGVLQRTPRSILSDSDRERIASVMSFEDKKVKDLMVSKKKMVFVKANETLGPLVLDKLYKSGFTSFPVVNEKEKVVGIIHTEALNTLTVREAEQAKKYADKKVNYLKVNDSLKFAVEEIERTNGYYFLVNDENGETVGFFTTDMLLKYLIG